MNEQINKQKRKASKPKTIYVTIAWEPTVMSSCVFWQAAFSADEQEFSLWGVEG